MIFRLGVWYHLRNTTMHVWIQNPFDNLPAEGYRKQRYWLMAEAFVRAGHRVTLWTADFNHMTKAPRRLSGPKTPGIDVRLIPTPPYRKNVGFARLRSHRAYARNWLRLAGADLAHGSGAVPDLIVTSTPSVSAAEAALLLGKSCGRPVVVDVMDAWPETFERLVPRVFRGFARLALKGLRHRAQAVYRDAACVTGVCDRYRAVTGRADYYRAYHGLELSAPPETRSPVTGRPLRLVYAGNLGRTYDLGTVLRGLEGLDARLDIAGRGPCTDAWRRLTDGLGLRDRVTFHGYLDGDELASLLRASDVGLVPMAPESFVGIPYKLADYAAAGLSVVSSLGGESAALLTKYGCGADYRPGDVRSFVAAVRRVGECGTGDVAGLCRAFDAVRIYDDYVRQVLGRLAGR